MREGRQSRPSLVVPLVANAFGGASERSEERDRHDEERRERHTAADGQDQQEQYEKPDHVSPPLRSSEIPARCPPNDPRYEETGVSSSSRRASSETVR